MCFEDSLGILIQECRFDDCLFEHYVFESNNNKKDVWKYFYLK